MAINTLIVHDSVSLSNCPTCDLIIYRIGVGTTEEHAELYDGGTKELLCQSQISWDALAGTISDKTGTKIIDCFEKNLSTYVLSADMVGKWYMHNAADDTTKTPALYKNAWYEVKSDGATPPTLSLERISTVVDDTTIEKNTDNKYQIKDLAITVSKLADNAVETSKIKDGNVTKAKIDTTAKVVYEEDTQILKNKEMSGDDNAFYDLETGVFKAGQIITKEDTGDLPEDDTKLVGAWRLKNELANKDITLEKQATAEAGYIATYVLKKGGTELTPKINIPKDFLVKSAKVTTVVNYAVATAYSKLDIINDDLTNTWVVKADITAEDNTSIDVVQKALLSTKRTTGDKYLVFEINVKEGTAESEFLFIDVKDLVDVYSGSDTIDISATNIISIKDNSITLAKLANATIANKGKTAVVGDDGAWIYGKFMKFIDVTSYPTSNIDDEVLYRKITSNKIKQYNLTAEASLDYIITTAGIEHVGFETTSWADVTTNWDSTWASKFVEAENGEVTKYTTTGGSIAYIDTTSFTETLKCEVQYHKGNAWYKLGKPSVDNTTIEENTSEQLQVKDSGISTNKLANGSVTFAKIDSDSIVTNILEDPVNNKIPNAQAVYQYGKLDETTLDRDTENGIYVKEEGIDTTQLKDSAVTKSKINANAKVVYEEDTQTLKNKTFNALLNTLSNVSNTNLKPCATTDTDKVYKVKSDGTWELGFARNYKEVATFTGETGDTKTLYYLTAKVDSYTIGLYRFDGTNFIKCGGSDLFEDVTTFPTTDIDGNKLYRRSNLYKKYKVANDFVSTHEITVNGLQEVGGGVVTANWSQLTNQWNNYVDYFAEDTNGTCIRFYNDDTFTDITACFHTDFVVKYYVKYYKDGWNDLGGTSGGVTYSAGTNITINSDNVISSMPILEVDSYPVGGQSQKILYKLKTQNAISWWNGTDWADISSSGGMISVTTLPTTDIQESLLYKLTQNMTHQSEDKYRLATKAFVESTTPIAGVITHNTTTNKWYNGTDQITVESVTEFPEPSSVTSGNYYFDGTLLKLGETYKDTIVDYYTGIYAHFEGAWQALATSNFSVDYSSTVVKNKPVIGGQEVNGTHDIGYYGGLTQSFADGKYQPKQMDNPLSGFTATTVEGTLQEIATKYGSAIRIMGQISFITDLPQTPSVGDMYTIKYIWDSDYTSNYGMQRVAFIESETPIAGKITHNATLDEWYNGYTPMTVNNVTTFPSATAANVGQYYFKGSDNDLRISSVGKYTEQYLNKCWNGVQWFDYGSGNIDLSKYERRTDVTDKVKTANSGISFGDDSLVVQDSTLTMGYIHGTLSTPVTDIQSADRELMTIPSDIGSKGLINLVNIKTHGGEFTALENKAALPTSYRYVVYATAVTAAKLGHIYSGKELTFKTASGHTGTGIEYDTSNSKWYKDNVEIEVTNVTEFPEWEATTVDKYYYNTTTTKLNIGTDTAGIWQDYNTKTGALMYSPDGNPLIANSKGVEQVSTSVATIMYDLDYEAASPQGLQIIAYKEETITDYTGATVIVKVPLYKAKTISLQANSTYEKNCQIADTGLHIDADGNYGDWEIVESELSKKYASHDSTYGLKHGFAGTCVFTKRQNISSWQWKEAYVSSNKVYVKGDFTIDQFRINCIW